MDEKLKKQLVNITQLAELMGVNRRTARVRVEEIEPTPVENKQRAGPSVYYRLSDVVDWKKSAQDEPETPEKQFSSERERNDYYASELKRLQYELQTKQVLKREDVRAAVAQWSKLVADNRQSIYDALEMRGIEPKVIDTVQTVLDSEQATLYQRIEELFAPN